MATERHQIMVEFTDQALAQYQEAIQNHNEMKLALGMKAVVEMFNRGAMAMVLGKREDWKGGVKA